MNKTNSTVIHDFVSSTWFGQNKISRNDTLIAAHNILFSYGIPLCVYERNTPYPFKIRDLKGKHKKNVDILIAEIMRFSNTSWKMFAGKLNVYGNDNDPRRKIIDCGGNMPYQTV